MAALKDKTETTEEIKNGWIENFKQALVDKSITSYEDIENKLKLVGLDNLEQKLPHKK